MNYGRPAYPYPQAQQQNQASVGGCGDWNGGNGGNTCSTPPAQWNSFQPPSYGYPGVDPVQQAALRCLPPGPDGSQMCFPAGGAGPGMVAPGGYPTAASMYAPQGYGAPNMYPGNGPYGGGYQGLCGIYPQARGPVCTAIGIPPTVIPALGTASLTVNPPNPSQIRCLDIPSDIAASLNLESFTIGGRPVLYGPIPMRIFTEVSEACSKYFTTDTMIPGVGAQMVVSNTLAAPVTLRGALGITELRC